MSIAARLKPGIFAGMYWSGAADVYALAARPEGAIVLMYHSVSAGDDAGWIDPANSVPVATFEEQMRFLSSRRRVVSMSELVSKLERGDEIAGGTVAITFDDGYLDNLQHAAPILQRYNLPATLYVPTGLIDRCETQWIDRLHGMVEHRTAHSCELEGAGTFDLRTPDQRGRFKRTVVDRLISADRAGRESVFASISGMLRPASPDGSAAPPRRLTMNWDEVRRWSRTPGLSVGVHTVEHVDLTACSAGTAEAEISGSIARANEMLESRVEHFSFPYARSTPSTRAMVRALGLRSAVIHSPDLRVRRGGAVDGIPRIAAPSSRTLFRFFTSPAYPDFPLRTMGRA